jgi:hypothetical protein
LTLCPADLDLVKRQNISPPTRRSARLLKKARFSTEQNEVITHLPSPESIIYEGDSSPLKRKAPVEEATLDATDLAHKKRKTVVNIADNPYPGNIEDSPITHWVLHGNLWPPDYANRCPKMDFGRSSKRRSSSSHTSDRLQRLEAQKVFLDSQYSMAPESEELCKALMEGSQSPPGYPMYPEDKRGEVIKLMASAPEALIQQYLTPVIIPSILVLRLHGRIQLQHFGDEINALWTRAETLGSTQPKPDYVAGLRMSAFDSSTQEKLVDYATPATPVLLTSEICFPLVIGEVKSSKIGLQEAQAQALHAASIALKSIISLHWQAYGKEHEKVKELYGKALVFSLCHNHNMVHASAHYAILEENSIDKLQFHRQELAFWSLTLNGGRDKDKPYNFVENVYKVCGPTHLKMIKEAAEQLPDPRQWASRSVDTYQSVTGQNQQIGETPGNDALVKLQAVMKEQKEEGLRREQKLEKMLEQQRAESKAQLEQQRADSKAQLEQQRLQLEQQKADNKAQLEQQRAESKAQLEQQKADSKIQMDQLQEIIKLLKDSKNA